MKKFVMLLLILLLLAAALALYAHFVEPTMLRVQYVSLKEGPPLRIAFFSDTHFGRDYAQDNLARIVEKINAHDPDIVAFGGDFIDDYNRDRDTLELSYIKEQLASITGTKFAVWGNHDYGGGAEATYRELMEGGGFQLLTNESSLLEDYGLTVIGYDELLYGQRDDSLRSLSTGGFNLLLSHEPDIVAQITADTQGLMLAGHSHGGQVVIPFIRPALLPSGAKQFWKGLYSEEKTGGLNQLFVSSGIGTSVLLFRFLNVPEVVILDLGAES